MNGRGEEHGVPDTDGAPYARTGARADAVPRADGAASPWLPAGVRPMPGDPRYIGGYRLLGRLGEGGMGFSTVPAKPAASFRMAASRSSVSSRFSWRSHCS